MKHRRIKVPEHLIQRYNDENDSDLREMFFTINITNGDEELSEDVMWELMNIKFNYRFD